MLCKTFHAVGGLIFDRIIIFDLSPAYVWKFLFLLEPNITLNSDKFFRISKFVCIVVLPLFRSGEKVDILAFSLSTNTLFMDHPGSGEAEMHARQFAVVIVYLIELTSRETKCTNIIWLLHGPNITVQNYKIGAKTNWTPQM